MASTRSTTTSVVGHYTASKAFPQSTIWSGNSRSKRATFSCMAPLPSPLVTRRLSSLGLLLLLLQHPPPTRQPPQWCARTVTSLATAAAGADAAKRIRKRRRRPTRRRWSPQPLPAPPAVPPPRLPWISFRPTWHFFGSSWPLCSPSPPLTLVASVRFLPSCLLSGNVVIRHFTQLLSRIQPGYLIRGLLTT